MRILFLFSILSLPFSLSAQNCEAAERMDRRAEKMLEQEKYNDSAFAVLKTAYASCPELPKTSLLLGDFFNNILQIDSARFYYNRFLHFNENNGIAHRKLAGTYFSEGDYTTCQLELDKSLAANPNDTITWYNKAETYYYQQNPAEAEKWFSKVMQQSPQNLPAGLRLIELWSDKNKTESSWQLLEQLKKTHRNDYDLVLAESQLFIRQHLYDQALQRLNFCRQLDSMQTATYFMQAIIFEETGKYDDALNCYNKIITLDPENADAYLDRGNLLADLQQPELALLDYEECLSLDSSVYQAWMGIGNIHADNQFFTAAVVDFSHYIDQNGNDANAFYNRGNAYFNLQQFDEALTDYNRCIGIDARQTDAYYNRALIKYLTEDYGGAVTDLNYYIKTNPQDTEAYYYRCLAYLSLGKKEEACTDCNMAVFLGKKDIPRNLLKNCKAGKKNPR